MAFDKNFTWGAATASFQIEGAHASEGKGRSIWDHMNHTPGRAWNGDHGNIACDHYNRYQEDASLMKEIGLQGYRFSLSWPRIMANGVGAVNEKGLEFYDRLVDAQLENGVTPWGTLFHWDLPWALHLRGGWLNPDIASYFEAYTEVVVKRLGDRVKNWMTLNEPQCFIGLGYLEGIHAPGLKMSVEEVLYAGHNALRAHGKAVKVIRHLCKGSSIGAAPTGSVVMPATDRPADIEAAYQEMFSVFDDGRMWNIAWLTDPMILGTYPEDGLKVYGDKVPTNWQEDMKEICQPLDFCGANLYNGWTVKADGAGCPVKVDRPRGYPVTRNDWPVTPEAMYWGPIFYHRRYNLPIVITENGMSGHDWIVEDGTIPDFYRIDFLTKYLRQLKKAADQGVPIQGYFCWSLLDNLEWVAGFKERFGLIHVDFQTLKRTLKESAKWYKTTIHAHGENLEEVI